MWDRSKVELHISSQVCNAGAASNAFRELQILWDKVTVTAEQLCPVEGNGSGLSAIQCTSPNVMDPYELAAPRFWLSIANLMEPATET